MGENIRLKLKKAISIDQLYERVKGYDLVLTVDAPLTDALNARLEAPRLDHFATTPHRLALSRLADEEKIQDKRELFLKVIEKTELSLKHADYLLDNVTNCWRETGEIDTILDYEGFDNHETRQVIRILSQGINQFNALAQYRIPDDLSVAVIGLHQFSQLDRKILPEDHDTIDIFHEESHTLPGFRIFNSVTEIVEAVVNNIKEPGDVAVVMEDNSTYRHSIESALRARDIPYMVSTNLKEDDDLRTYLNILRFGLSRRGLKLRDVRPILYHLNKRSSIVQDEFFIENITDGDVRELEKLLKSVPSLTFQDSVKEYEKLVGKEQGLLKEHLDKLGLLDKKVTEEKLNSFKYYLESFEISTEPKKHGVLIASPGSAYVDRSVIFYLGMDSSWTPIKPVYPWADRKEFDERKLTDFTILLQNGELQYFMVQNKVMNQYVTPDYYLNEFTRDEVEKFTDFEHAFYGVDLSHGAIPFPKEDLKIKPLKTQVLSKSALNVLAYCPKDYFFNRFVDRPDKVYFRKGHILHDFAEFYINYPEIVESTDQKIFLMLMMDEMIPYIDGLEIPLWETQFKIGMCNLREYLDPKEEYEVLPGYERRTFSTNIFSEHFGKPIYKPITEAWFSNEEVGASGIVDLIESKDHIIDHKSGKKSTIDKIMRLSEISDLDKKPEFQAKVYLAHHRSVVPGERIRFTFFYILENIRGRVSGEGTLADNIVDINYYPVTFDEMVHLEVVYYYLVEGVAETNNRRKTLVLLGYDGYRDFFGNRELPEDLLEEGFLDEFVAYTNRVTDNTSKYITKGCKSALKKLVKFRSENYFKDDLDEFEVFLSEQIALENGYKLEGFPVGDVDPDQLDNKDLVIL